MIAPPPRMSTARTAPLRATTASGGPAAETPVELAPAPLNDGTQATVVAQLVAALERQASPADLALEAQREAFDEQTRLQAEILRETNALRDLSMQAVKNDDEVLKKWIALA